MSGIAGVEMNEFVMIISCKFMWIILLCLGCVVGHNKSWWQITQPQTVPWSNKEKLHEHTSKECSAYYGIYQYVQF